MRSVITGYQPIKTQLAEAIKAEKLPHAVMVSGMEGGGSLPLAIWLGQYLLCAEKANDEPCGTCKECTKSGKLIHPDFHFFFPIHSTKSKKSTSSSKIEDWRAFILENPYCTLFDWLTYLQVENKQAQIAKDDADDLLKVAQLKSFQSSEKVFVIWMPEKLNPAAANRILKTIEEPTSGTYFIFVTHDEERVLETIRSRTQIFRLPPLKHEEIKSALISEFGFDEGTAEQASMLANGNIHDALAIRSEEDTDFITPFQTWMRDVYGGKVPGLLKWSDEFASYGREKQKQFLRFCLKMFEQCLMVNYGDDTLVNISPKQQGFFQKFSPFIHAGNCIDITTDIEAGIRDIERNGNPKIMMSDLSFKLAKLLRIKNVNL